MKSFQQFFVTDSGIEGQVSGLLMEDSERPIDEQGTDWPDGTPAKHAFVVAGLSKKSRDTVKPIDKALFDALRANTAAIEALDSETDSDAINSLQAERRSLLDERT